MLVYKKNSFTCFNNIAKLFVNLKFIIQKLTFPRRCVLCAARGQDDLDICIACAGDLPYMKNACPSCGAILPNEMAVEDTTKQCGACFGQNLPFQCVYAAFLYQNPIAQLLIDLKFNQKLLYAKVLGTLMADYLEKCYSKKNKPQLIIPVPLHKKRLRERGYNQALELARPIEKRLQIPVDKYSCVRVKQTAAQSLLPFDERQSNVRQAFAIRKPLAVKYVAIFDDILTTGSTVKELSQVLRKAGVTKIDVWCCAKTVVADP
ncbi:MAG: hypothetical protein A2X78_02465 [Gammaproteobacteria bacterium GWE2_37_16]|nr:MAG: hypothetical protein A2X78_02465 [Gammaproteobacteria bacterium GWE2_37_16]